MAGMGFLSLLGWMLRHKHTPSFILLYRPNDVRATFHRVGDVARRGVIADTTCRRSNADRQGRADRRAKLLRRSVTPIQSCAATAPHRSGYADCGTPRSQYVSLWYMTGSTRFSTTLEASRFSNESRSASSHIFRIVNLFDLCLISADHTSVRCTLLNCVYTRNSFFLLICHVSMEIGEKSVGWTNLGEGKKKREQVLAMTIVYG